MALRRMIGRVVGLVLAHRDTTAGELASDRQHRLGGAPLGRASGLAEHACHRQAVTLLHGDVAHIRQFRLATGRLAIQPAVRVGGALVRVVLAGLPVEVRTVLVTAVLGAEAPL